MAVVDESTRFSGYVAIRNNETVVRWQKVQIFFLINSVLLGTTVSVTLAPKFKIAICIFGFVVTVIWWLMQWEAQNAVDYWGAEIARLEPKEKDMHGFAFPQPRGGFRFKFVSTHFLILFLVDLFGVGWIGLFFYYLLFSPKG